HGPGAGIVARLVDDEEDLRLAARVRPEVVPLVGEGEIRWVMPGGGMGSLLDPDPRGLNRRVAHEPGSAAEECAVEGPGVLGVRRRMDAHPAAAVADVGLQGC